MGLFSFLQPIYAEEAKEEEKPEQEEQEGGEEASNEEEEAGEEAPEEEEEEEEEPEDSAPEIQEKCSESKECKAAKHHFEECASRVSEGKPKFGKNEDCVEEFFHLRHCVDTCSANKIFATLK